MKYFDLGFFDGSPAEKKNIGLKILFVFFLSLFAVGCGDSVEKEPEKELTAEELEAQTEQKEIFFSTLTQLEARYGQISFAQRVQDSKIRVKIVDELMELQLTPEERSRALVSQFDALQRLHETREIKSSERLAAMANELAADPDRNVSRAAMVSRVAVHLVTFIRTEFGAYEPLRDGVKVLLKNFPEDLEVASRLETVAIQLFRRDKSKEANEIMAMMLDVYSASKNEQIQRYVGILNDRIKLVELNFRGLVQNLELGGNEDRKAFLKMLDKLTQSGDSLGFAAYEEISRAGRWLERIQQYKTAGQVYEAMAKSLTNHPQPALAKQARFESEFGIRRLRQIGTKLELRGENVFGDDIDPNEFQDKVVLVMFWSAEKPLSLRAMGELFSIYSMFSRDQFEIVAISTDTDPKKPIEVLGTQIPPWTILLPNVNKKAGEESLIDECAVNYVPYTVLLDPKGRVSQINIPGNALEDRIKRLLMDFGKTPVINEPVDGPKMVSPVEQTG